MKNDEHDSLDCAARRDEAIQTFKLMRTFGKMALKHPRMTDGDRETANLIETHASTVFEKLDDLFIAPHAAANPALAAEGYFLLQLLMRSSFDAGLGGLSSLEAIVDKSEHRRRSAKGGKAPRDKVQKWTAEALPIAREYVASHPNYRKSRLEAHLTGKKIEGAPRERALRNQISKWQKTGEIPHSKKYLEAKHASQLRK